MPNGFVAHLETKFRSEDVSGKYETSTYVVVDTPVALDESIERLILAYEWRGWKQMPSNDGTMGKNDKSCLSFQSKDNFIEVNDGMFDGKPLGVPNKDRIDWVNRAVTEPERQLIISLGCY